MQRINALDPETTIGKSKELFNAVHRKLGMVPNMMRTMGASPSVLNGYLAFNGALADSSLGAKVGELIALTVANLNRCGYCNAAHGYIGEKLAGIDPAAIESARAGKSGDTKTQAVLSFASRIVVKQGRVSDADVETMRSAGFGDAAIAEVIAHTALNIFTNYFNNAAGVVIDFPQAELVASGEAGAI